MYSKKVPPSSPTEREQNLLFVLEMQSRKKKKKKWCELNESSWLTWWRSESAVMLFGPAGKVKQGVQVEDPGDAVRVGKSLCASIAETESTPNVILDRCAPDHSCILFIHQLHAETRTEQVYRVAATLGLRFREKLKKSWCSMLPLYTHTVYKNSKSRFLLYLYYSPLLTGWLARCRIPTKISPARTPSPGASLVHLNIQHHPVITTELLSQRHPYLQLKPDDLLKTCAFF